MNHDYAHCYNCDDMCPDDCFRAQLVRDLDRIIKDGGKPMYVSWSTFIGTDECKRKDDEASN